MGPTPILEMARAYGLRPRLWLLVFTFQNHVRLKNLVLNEKLTFDQSNKSLQSVKVSNLIIGVEFFSCWPPHFFRSHFPFW